MAEPKHQLTQQEYMAISYRLALEVGSIESGFTMRELGNKTIDRLINLPSKKRKAFAEETLQGLNRAFEMYQSSVKKHNITKLENGDRIPHTNIYVRGVMTTSKGKHRYFLQIGDNSMVVDEADLAPTLSVLVNDKC